MAMFDLTSEEAELIREFRERNGSPPWSPRPLDTIPVHEKVTAFDELYRQAAEYLNAVVTKDRYEDIPHYIFEAVMESTLGKDVWEPINAALR